MVTDSPDRAECEAEIDQGTRKHLYLITEHEEDDRVGSVSFFDTRSTMPNKNEEAPIRVLDEDKEGFEIVGKKVGLGYYDFDSQSEYEDPDVVARVMTEKIQSVDRKWAEKAGITEAVYDE